MLSQTDSTLIPAQDEKQQNHQQQQQPQQNQEMEKRPTTTQMFIPLIISFREICVVTALLPLITLTICFVTAYIFQAEEIHETHCKVYNIIPSISAITGVSPQRYLWRICITLHIGPRFAIAAVYRNYYRALNAQFVPAEERPRVHSLIKIVFVLNVIEIGALCCVTYVSNRENYPVHEKLFITFMITSLFHMLVSIKLVQRINLWRPFTEAIRTSLWWKKALFATSMASTAGLIIFFLKHRLLCHDMAFSFFAFCEYLIAAANMGFHWTCTFDFPTEDFLIAKGTDEIRRLYAEQFTDKQSVETRKDETCVNSSEVKGGEKVEVEVEEEGSSGRKKEL